MKKEIGINKIKNEVKGLLEKTRRGLKRMGKETSVFAKRSEKELSKLAKVGRAEVDILSLNIKKNQLYHQIGKQVYQLNTQGKLTTRNLKKLCCRISEIEKDLKNRKRSVAKYLKKRG